MNVYLIGYRGSGKSSVAPLLAELLDWKHHDTDIQVELLAGTTISEIFQEYGERNFREWETTVIEAFSYQSHFVISMGGGAPTTERNRKLMKETGKTIWLSANEHVLWARIQADDVTKSRRPALTDLNGLQEIKELLSVRKPIYEACADYTIETDDMSPKQIAERIANWLDPVDK